MTNHYADCEEFAEKYFNSSECHEEDENVDYEHKKKFGSDHYDYDAYEDILKAYKKLNYDQRVKLISTLVQTINEN